MDLNSESSEDEASANDGCVILDVRRAATPSEASPSQATDPAPEEE